MSIPHRTMTNRDVAAFLAAPRHALVATRRKDGSPQLSPVWFLFEESRLWFAVQSQSAKAANMRRDPRIAVCVDAGHPDARSVTFYGRVTLHPDEGEYATLHARIAGRYCESDANAERYLAKARMASAVWVACLVPDKVLARDYND